MCLYNVSLDIAPFFYRPLLDTLVRLPRTTRPPARAPPLGIPGRHPASYSLQPPLTHAQAAAQDAQDTQARRATRKADRKAARTRDKAKEAAARKATARTKMVNENK